MMTRLEANRKILESISKSIEGNPDWRFHQVLQNLRLEIPGVDQWYEESETSLERMVGYKIGN